MGFLVLADTSCHVDSQQNNGVIQLNYLFSIIVVNYLLLANKIMYEYRYYVLVLLLVQYF